ncbi:MAG: DegQ family serine endoprotease [Candidatus Binatia bacterium]
MSYKRFLFLPTATISALCLTLLATGASSLWALDIFGTGKKEEPQAEAVPKGRLGTLPSLSEVARRVSPAVVNISTTQKPDPSKRRTERRRRPSPFGPGPNPFGGGEDFEEFFRRFFGDRPPSQQRSLGSGFLISDDGYIITNNHVVGEDSKIMVRLSDKEEYEAKVIGTDEKTDLALIKINSKHTLPAVPLGQSKDLEVGDWVIAIGNPFGLEQTVTAGIVSAKGRVINAGPYDDFIQTDASINPGNSGGPLINLQGEVIGINTAIFSSGGGNIGIGFAIPIDQAKTIIDQLKEKGKVTRGWLGVAIQAVTPELAKSFGLNEPAGALVAEVTSGGPAEKAGLQRGDIITAFKGETIKDSHDLPALVARSPVGDRAEVKVLRNGKEQTYTVKLGELPDQQAQAEQEEGGEEGWGMSVANLSSEAARRFQIDPDQKGVVVTDVDPYSPAGSSNIQPGDIIEEVNRQPVNSVDDFNKAITNTKDKDTLLLLVRRGNASTFFALRKEG